MTHVDFNSVLCCFITVGDYKATMDIPQVTVKKRYKVDWQLFTAKIKWLIHYKFIWTYVRPWWYRHWCIYPSWCHVQYLQCINFQEKFSDVISNSIMVEFLQLYHLQYYGTMQTATFACRLVDCDLPLTIFLSVLWPPTTPFISPLSSRFLERAPQTSWLWILSYTNSYRMSCRASLPASFVNSKNSMIHKLQWEDRSHPPPQLREQGQTPLVDLPI